MDDRRPTISDKSGTHRPLSILFCALDYYPSAAGGAERQARLQAEELVRRGHRVTVVCGRSRGQRSGMSEVNGVTVHRLPKILQRPITMLSFFIMLGFWLLVRGRRYDLWHVHLANVQADVAVLAGLVVRRPVYVKVAAGGSLGEVGRLKKISWATQWVGLRHASRVQALSQQIVDDLKSIGVEPERIVAIPNGLDLQSFAPSLNGEKRALRERLGLPPDAPIVLYIGRFARYKGIADLLKGWERVKPTDALLLLVGGPSVDSPYAVPETRDGFVVHAWTDDVPSYLRCADIFAYPSHADGMSNALLEALACGVATVATDIEATHGLLENDVNSVLVPPRSPDELSRALQALLADAAQRRRLAAAARATAERYAIATVVDRIEGVYRDVLRGG